MVIFNSQLATVESKPYTDVDFKYLIDVPRCDCVFGSAREKTTGKSLLFLIFNHHGKIYRRNGRSGTWVELRNDEEYSRIRELLLEAISDKHIPCYTTAKEFHG